MLQASLAAYVVCGAFLSMSYFDLFFHLVAIVIILKKLVFVHEQESANARTRAVVQQVFAPVPIR
jgi:putative inorganic carbon (HCO3(-)) transporter